MIPSVNQVITSNINNVSNRFLPIAENVAKNLEAEPKIIPNPQSPLCHIR